MKNTLKVVPLFLLALAVIGCGPSGGAAGSPEEIAEAVKDSIISESFADGYSYLPAWQIESAEGFTEAKKWRMEEGYEKWKPLKERLERKDPKDKSDLVDEDKWTEASPAERWAVLQGFYQLYEIDKMESRLGEGLWYLANREVNLQEEGEGRASISYMNKFEDVITVHCNRENGLWSLAGVEWDFPKEREKPSDD